ncbi:hypothetical protein SKAU_G00217870 [Synaphobranchus kaupii]|uniref:Jacalin-type lectin domain-containing protein n=1 Tax=Synaphobranchus kaupii TaxID=118154 RepID=A0A9Q1FAA7_SYNKA|nr:hypothetical protein SKAU_G00217870 [Synaphobranchus kaupii]
MIYILIFSLYCLTAGAQSYVPQYYSFSPAVGRGSGTSYSSSGEGRITAIRVWEINGAYIRGFQLRYGYAWTPVYGRNINEELEMLLFEDEAIVQISGTYNPGNFIYQLIFVTNRGRFLMAGQPTGKSFNFYPRHSQSELRLISGRNDSSGITSIAAHWGMVYPVAPGVPMSGNGTMLGLQ